MKPKLEDDIPVPGEDTKSYEVRMLEAENALLKAQLENAELRVKLAELKKTESLAETTIVLGRPIPTPEQIPDGIPPMPEINPALGDKTQEFVQWLYDHWREEFDARYKGRITHLSARNVAHEEEEDDQSKPTFQPSSNPGFDLSPRTY